MRPGCWLVVALVTVCALLCCWAAAAVALPAGRQYELASPPFKGGFGVLHIEAVASEGEGVVYYSPGAFAGAPAGPTAGTYTDYLARRGATEWSTMPLMPPASLLAHWERADLSPTLSTLFAVGHPGPDSEDPLSEAELLLHSTSLPDSVANWELFGRLEGALPTPGLVGIKEHGADPDFCHILLTSGGTPLVPPAIGTVPGQLYEFNRGCGGERAGVSLVALDNRGNPINPGCGVDFGAEDYAFHGIDTFNALSADGSEAFFTDCLSGTTKATSPHQLFVRLGGARTVEVSRPLLETGSKSAACAEVPCEEASQRASAEFQGASEDGSRVFFSAPLQPGQAPLVPGDADASNNLYMASIGCPQGRPGCATAEREVVALTEVSHDENGGAADVNGVLRVAPDGRRAYFVAGGDLLGHAQQQALESEGRAAPQLGAANLYAYDAGGAPALAFIGELCTGQGRSDGVPDIDCPGGSDAALWASSAGEAQTAGAEGAFLVFSTYARLTADDTNAARDVYRYDAESGALERVSTGEGGYDANGNAGLLGSRITGGNRGASAEGGAVVSQYEMNSRALSEDGARIVFFSAEPLSPAASNGLENLYEWHENPGGSSGSVALISSGSGEEAVDDAVMSPSGQSVFFDTVEGLVPQDTDGAPDVYDARLERPGEAFPQPEAQRRPCEGDACQGPLTNPAALLVPGSVVQAPGQNLASARSKAQATSKPKCKRGYKRNKRGVCAKVKKASKAAKGSRRGRASKSSGGRRL